MSPWSINQTEERIFYGLLKYIENESTTLKIAFLKRAKRCSEVLKIYFQSHEYAKFYRLAFAQGPKSIALKKPSDSTLDVTTYYDSALRLSSTLGHNVVNAAFVISSCRSFLYHPKSEGPQQVFHVTQLKCLSTVANRDANTRVNAHLLLAKYDHRRVEDAIEVCRQFKCLPGEIELVVFLSHCEKLPSMISYQLEIVHKICFLLSLDQKHLINAYKIILGLFEGKSDELYTEETQFTAELKLSSFVMDCYLLPNKSQDIWLRTLTQGKEFTKDVDGMYIIQPAVLFRQIKKHLEKALNKTLSKIIPKSFLFERQLEQCENFYINFDIKSISVCLDCCELALLHSAGLQHESVKLLRQYHSIGNVHCLPLCENYISYIYCIRRNKRVWKFFQSETCQWITEILTDGTVDHFDFLKVWEQSSVAMVTHILSKILHDQESKIKKDGFKASCRAAITWLDISKHVLDNPMKSCHGFFYTCLPELLKLKHSLHSIVNSIAIYGTIALALIACTSSTSNIVIPQVYLRALLVYDSLLLRNRNQTIFSACYDLASHLMLPVLLDLLKDAITQVISILMKEYLYECEELTRQSLILVLTLFTNYIMLQPMSGISDAHTKLKKSLDCKIQLCERFKLNYLAVSTAIKHARNTVDYVKVIRYLSSSSCSEIGRYEGLALLTVSARQRRIIVNVLDDEEVQSLLQTPESVSTAKLEALPVVPLLPVADRKRHLFFKIHQFRGKYFLPNVDLAPPWVCFQNCTREIDQPDLLQFVDLGFSQDLHSSLTIRTEAMCQVCKVAKENNHILTEHHKKNLALYKQFSALHDIDYVQCEAKFRKILGKVIMPQAEVLLTSINNMITAVYKSGEWEKGIDLVQTYCIPKVKDIIAQYLKT